MPHPEGWPDDGAVEVDHADYRVRRQTVSMIRMSVVKRIVPSVAVAGLVLVVAFGVDRASRVVSADLSTPVVVALVNTPDSLAATTVPVATANVRIPLPNTASVRAITLSLANAVDVEVDTVSGVAPTNQGSV